MPIDTIEMFPESMAGERLADPIPPGLTLRQHRTALAMQALDMGRHPVNGLPLHPQAPLDAGPKDRIALRPFTCGGCVHRQSVVYFGTRSSRCELAVEVGNRTPTRSWYPACDVYREIPAPS